MPRLLAISSIDTERIPNCMNSSSAFFNILSFVSILRFRGTKLWKLFSLPKFPSLFFTFYTIIFTRTDVCFLKRVHTTWMVFKLTLRPNCLYMKKGMSTYLPREPFKWKKIFQYFLQGLLVIAPLAITAYTIYWVVSTVDNWIPI